MKPTHHVIRVLVHPATGEQVAVKVPVYGPPDEATVRKAMRKRRSNRPRASRVPLWKQDESR